MAMGRGAYTTISTSTSAPTQRSQDNRSEKPTTLRTTEYRPLRSPIDSSTALWNEGRRKRIIELEAQLRCDDSQRRLEERNQRKESGGAERQSHQSRQSTTRESRVSSKTNEKGRRETTGPAAAGESSDGETENRSDRYRRREGGTSLSPGTASNVGLSLEQRLGLWERGWRPPRLRELPRGGEGFFSGWTHLGQPERFELVKSTNRSLGSHDAELTDAELEWAVLSLEDAEERMDSLQFSEAANVLENVLIRCPSLTLAYYRLALCLLAARGMHASKQAMRLLDCAMFLEGAGNPHLASAVDLILRMLRNDFIPEELWSEDHPKSLGDLRALEAALDHFM